jgi:hypothetical protein
MINKLPTLFFAKFGLESFGEEKSSTKLYDESSYNDLIFFFRNLNKQNLLIGEIIINLKFKRTDAWNTFVMQIG